MAAQPEEPSTNVKIGLAKVFLDNMTLADNAICV